MLAHHSHVDYNEAASDAARHAKTVLEATIIKGQKAAAEVIGRIASEQPDDVVMPGKSLAVSATEGKADVLLNREEALALHPHAFGQLCERVGVPGGWANKLLCGSAWQEQLLQHALNTSLRHVGGRYLLRSREDTVLGFLSDRYRRLDSRPTLEAFAKTCVERGLVPVDGTHAETKWGVKALLPKIFEPVKHEVLCYGLQLRNSDYGDGKLVLSTFVLRLWCTNKAIGQSLLDKVHLGHRLPDDVRLSQQTYDLDSQAHASLVHDLVAESLGPEQVERMNSAIAEADSKALSWDQARRLLPSGLGKEATTRLKDSFEGDDRIERLPQNGQTRWRLSNALSWAANETTDPSQRMDLEQAAGRIAAFGGAA